MLMDVIMVQSDGETPSSTLMWRNSWSSRYGVKHHLGDRRGVHSKATTMVHLASSVERYPFTRSVRDATDEPALEESVR